MVGVGVLWTFKNERDRTRNTCFLASIYPFVKNYLNVLAFKCMATSLFNVYLASPRAGNTYGSVGQPRESINSTALNRKKGIKLVKC